MRKILFRGKRSDNGEWVYGFYVLFGGKNIIMLSDTTELRPSEIFGLNELYEYPVIHEVVPDTVGQFTGLLDKNGNKIFEGDILKTEYSKVICEFGTGDFSNGCHSYQGWCFTDLEQDDSLRSNYNDSWYVQEYEIIGNKWDNPELLNP